MKISNLLKVGLLAALFQSNLNANVIFTEYVEGSSNNKALEISNLGSAEVDLGAEKYQVRLHSNGKQEDTNTLDLAGYVLPAGASLVIYNPSAEVAFQGNGGLNVSSTVTYFNGDDALTLTKDGVVVDRIGQYGQDPGSAWTSSDDADFTTKEKTIRRLDSINAGDVNATAVFPPSPLQWKTFAQNTSDGLGCPGEAACQPSDNGGGDNGGGDTGGEDPAVCVNCPEITKVADNSQLVVSDYYAAALSADANQLKTVLNTIISQQHKQLSYAQVWSVLTESDQDPQNSDNIIQVYTGWSVAKSNNASGAQSSDQDAWNREHTWPRSRGLDNDTAYAFTDVHHLKPSDVSVNSARAAFDFADGGEPLAEANANLIDVNAQTFEPRDEVKGDIARILFYMDTRYQGDSADLTPDLQLSDDLQTLTESQLGKLCTLLAWHTMDAVDAFEVNRNNVIYEYQGNRNPFIDYPEFADLIYADACDSAPDYQAPDIVFSGEQVVHGGEFALIETNQTQLQAGAQVSYTWQQIGGGTVTFKENLSALYFKAPETAQTLTFKLTLNDGYSEVEKTIAILVVQGDSQPLEDEDEDEYTLTSGAMTPWFVFLFVSLLFIRRAK